MSFLLTSCVEMQEGVCDYFMNVLLNTFYNTQIYIVLCLHLEFTILWYILSNFNHEFEKRNPFKHNLHKTTSKVSWGKSLK